MTRRVPSHILRVFDPARVGALSVRLGYEKKFADLGNSRPFPSKNFRFRVSTSDSVVAVGTRSACPFDRHRSAGGTRSSTTEIRFPPTVASVVPDDARSPGPPCTAVATWPGMVRRRAGRDLRARRVRATRQRAGKQTSCARGDTKW